MINELQMPELVKLVLEAEDAEWDFDDEDVDLAASAGESAVEVSGAGAGAAVGGISVPKMATGRRTFWTS